MDHMHQSIVPSMMNNAIEDNIRDAISQNTDEERMKELSSKLIETGRQDEVAKAVSDEDYRQALYDEFEI